MKQYLFFVIASIVVTITYGQQVTMYQHINFDGASKSFSPGTRISQLENWNPSPFWRGIIGCGDICNDNISSIKVPQGLKVTVWEHKDFTGRSMVFTSDISNLVPSGWNDIITSFVVEWYTPPPAPQAQNCVGNGVVTFNNQSSQSLWFYYWYAEDIASGSDECQIRKLWKKLDPGNNQFTIPKNKTLVFRICTGETCLNNYVKQYGTLYSCQTNNGLVNIF